MSFVKLWNGSEWIPPGGAIPESEADQKLIHRWTLEDADEEGGIKDKIGSADAIENEISAVEGDFILGAGAQRDGIGGFSNVGTLGSFGSSLNDDFAIAFSIDTSTNVGEILGVLGEGSGETGVSVRLGREDADNGQIVFTLDDDNGDRLLEYTDGDPFNDDDQPHRVVINKTGNNSDGVEIFRDKNPASTDNQFDEGFSSVSDLSNDFAVIGMHDGEDISGGPSGVFDDVCIFNSSLTGSEIDSYQRPWL